MRTKFVAYLLMATSAAVAVRVSDAAPRQITAGGLRAVWQRDGLSLWKNGTDHPFLTGAQLGQQPLEAEGQVDEIDDPLWGQGKQISLAGANGDQCHVVLFDALPFVMLRQTLVNRQANVRVIDKARMLDAKIDLGTAPDQLKTMSTAGLRDVADHPGAYAFLAIGDPDSRRGIVCAWLTHSKGSGVVFSDVEDDVAVLRARVDYGDLRVPSGREVQIETLLVGYFDDVREGLEQYGSAIARQLKIHLPDQPTVYCTWYHAGSSDEQLIAKNADFAREQLAPYGFQVMQIDDKWQSGVSKNGPRKDFSKARPDGPYPSGMKKTADYIRSRGLVPGIWFMPFAGTWNDPYWADKQQLFYKEGRSSDNYIAATNNKQRPDFEPGQAPYVARWGGTCLDMTNPAAQQYLHSIVHRIAHQWGYKYFKMDGLWTGTGTRLQYVNSSYQDDDLGQTTRFDPSLTPIQAYRKGLDIVRDTAGPDVFLLGCCAPQNMRSFGAAFGKVDAMRVGPDNGARPSGLIRGPMYSTRVFFLNKRVWYNDPDPVYVRESFPEQMAQTSVSWTALTGSLHSSSYSYYELPPKRLDILRHSMPSHTLKTVRPVDYLENDPARVWLLTDTRDAIHKYVVGLFNWDIQAPVHIEYPVDRIGLPAAQKFVGFDYWANQFVPPFEGAVPADLPPGGCRIISVRPITDHPQVVSTSRHVTQGVIDLRDEQWDSLAGNLSGVSEIVALEDYELRIVVPTGQTSWLLRKFEITDAPAGIQVRCAQEGPAARIRVHTPRNGKFAWVAHFEPGTVVAKVPPVISGLQGQVDLDQVRLSWQPCPGYGYRVMRDGEPLAVTNDRFFVDRAAKLGKSYTYAVQARGWNGQWSTPAQKAVQLPRKLYVPPPPPMPQVFCSTLKPVQASTGFGVLGINRSCMNTPLKLNGVVYQQGIGSHAPATLVYRIPKKAQRFVATVGIDDGKLDDQRSSIVFRVFGDVTEMGEPAAELARSPVLKNSKTRVWHFDVALTHRLREIRLVVEDAGDGKAADHADWVNAGFVLEDGVTEE